MATWAGGWDNQFGEPHRLTQQATTTMRSVARLTNSVGGQAFGEIGRALANGVGANAEYTIAQVAAERVDGINAGGKRTIAPYAVVPLHATTITEKEAFQAQMTPTWAPSPYPVDKAGNGGGGMGGTLNK